MAGSVGEHPARVSARQAFYAALDHLESHRAVERIWAHDASLWSDDPAVQAKIADRLGWLTVADRMHREAGDLAAFGREVRDAGIARVILLGMGGSSLCVEVMRQAFGSAPGYPTLTVVDTTDPATIRDLTGDLDFGAALFVVASKSGGTLETLSHAAYFYDEASRTLGDQTGSHFIAITDPGSHLEQLGHDRGYRRVFLNPPDIGGRYSVLSYFGLVPAALAGIDVARLLERAQAMMWACHKPAADNPGARLGTLMGGLANAGRDKVTLETPAAIASFGDWVEQLIAESTGKEGRGIVPVTGEALGPPAVYGDDRLFAHLHFRQDPDNEDERFAALDADGQPTIVLELSDVYDLGAEFFRWEFATAVAGKLLGINPFDEPNVQESKDNTNRILAEYEQSGHLSEPESVARAGSLALIEPGAGPMGDESFESRLHGFLHGVQPGDYLALMAYVAATPEHEEALQRLRLHLRDRLHVATTLGYGPRFLHSTGQLHKGGANEGVFIQFVAPGADGPSVPIPGKDYDFGTLKAAQALGDLQSLQNHGRRAIRIDLDGDIAGGLRALTAMVGS
ncbi:MAG TPA: hypothetical protein VFL91_04350 [Thermomicrobiales bacterium]|nr:hypothetical protein [Thermomicrobiales bacterium]